MYTEHNPKRNSCPAMNKDDNTNYAKFLSHCRSVAAAAAGAAACSCVNGNEQVVAKSRIVSKIIIFKQNLVRTRQTISFISHTDKIGARCLTNTTHNTFHLFFCGTCGYGLLSVYHSLPTHPSRAHKSRQT